MSDVAALVRPVRFGDVELQVEATRVVTVGDEPTATPSERIVSAYEDAEAAILGVASSVAATIGRMGEAARRPREVQVQFGLSVSVEGTVLVVKGTTGATLAVTLTYDAAR
ncbi:CU044_2847 family protein [Solwaraspora sp. WMMD1047]|uniref:CU044_2847 family protein n=1 Tax=Solwaraspora sp. WMMD1047 TaxID=3016102 RepID=UPI002416CC6D|nr:CU044_2847 family protein [Solwaraspora sp. WMMD1047]MDG4831812.1 CU044_2847 family protein [Solwaraspora sp. WMMD1047]